MMQAPVPARATWLVRLRAAAGLDFHVLVTLLSRGWTVIAGATTVIVLPLRLGSTEQGYYYTITSLLGLQILFEMGLGQVIIQLVGHEIAHLESVGEERFTGDAARLDRLASLMQLLQRWYRVAAVLFGVLAGVGGGFFLARRGVLPPGQWLGTWCIMVACTAANLTYVPALAMLEGCGRIGHVARLRMVQSVAGYSALWVSLVAGAGLWSAIMVPLASALSTGLWLRRAHIHTWLMSHVVATGAGIAWRRDVLPFQARIAISAMSGYFLFYAFTPLIFANRGAVEAGRFGIAMTVFNALAAVGTSWIYAKTPTMAMHIARGERRELDAIFFAVFKRSLTFTTAAAAGVVLFASLLTWAGVRQMSRIASPGVLCCLALVCVTNCVIFSLAAYMRAHREEPMHGVSVTGAIATVLVAYFGSKLGVLPMSMAYLVLTAGVMLPWTVALFRRYRRRSL
jgi:O-antigen/teichoic acid export membrane protein